MFFVYVHYCPETELSYVGQPSHLLLRTTEQRDGMSRWTARVKRPLAVLWEAFAARDEAGPASAT